MAQIENYPEQSMTGQFLLWGRSDSYAPSLHPSSESEEKLRELQRSLRAQDPFMHLNDKLHATIIYCPPRKLLEAVQVMTGHEYDIPAEAASYSDVANGLSAMAFFPPHDLTIPTDGLEKFDATRGTIVLRLGESAILSRWRQSARELMEYNLRSYHGITNDHIKELSRIPQFKWLFGSSVPHISLTTGSTLETSALAKVPIPEIVEFSYLEPESPRQFLGLNSILFDPDLAFDTNPKS